MKFGAVPIKEALGATAVHTIRQDGLVLKKGTPIGPAEVAALEAAASQRSWSRGWSRATFPRMSPLPR